VRNASVDPDIEDAAIGQYAHFQTELYIPPSVVDGRIPKNVFGNLDVYVPSMVPPGAVHIRALEAKHAAKLLNIDFADAVTGFQFKGRQGTAVIDGIVVASEHEEAVEAVLEVFAHAKAEALEAHRSAQVLRMWRRFLVGLRIVNRLNEYQQPGDVDDEDKLADEEFHRELADEELQREIEEEMELYEEMDSGDGGGGFMIEEDVEPAVPTAQSFLGHDDDLDNHDDDHRDSLSAERNEGKSLLKRNSSFGLEHFELPAVFHRTVLTESDGQGYLSGREQSRSSPGESGLEGVLPVADMGGGFLPEPDLGHKVLPATETDEFKPLTNRPTVDDMEETTRMVPQIPSSTAGITPMPTLARLDESVDKSHKTQATDMQTSNFLDGSQGMHSVSASPEAISIISKAENAADDPGWERGSSFDEALPSEDPEDEDAEPEWLL
jgi:xeroderma pigmentosum group C-complementing protein